jgi:hypothetical protein
LSDEFECRDAVTMRPIGKGAWVVDGGRGSHQAQGETHFGELYRYFGRVCQELTQKWGKAILKMPPSLLKELVGRLPRLEAVSHQMNQELKAAHLAPVKDPEFIEPLLDQTLAALEHISEDTAALMRRFDELLKA